MTTTGIVLLIIGIILILDSLFVFVFHKTTKNMLKYLLKKKNLKKIASWEIVLGVILVIISTLI